MSERPVIDAGPALNFLAVHQTRLLIGVLGKLSTPETVEAEVLRKSKSDPRVGTATILEAAATRGLISGRSQMRDIYQRLRGLDDGLVPLEETPLMDRRLWTSSAPR